MVHDGRGGVHVTARGAAAGDIAVKRFGDIDVLLGIGCVLENGLVGRLGCGMRHASSFPDRVGFRPV